MAIVIGPCWTKFLFTKIEEEDIGNIWLQQDAATWHTADTTLMSFGLIDTLKDNIREAIGEI